MFLAVAQSVFTNSLISGVKTAVPALGPELILSIGATDLEAAVPPKIYKTLTLKVSEDNVNFTNLSAILMLKTIGTYFTVVLTGVTLIITLSCFSCAL